MVYTVINGKGKALPKTRRKIMKTNTITINTYDPAGRFNFDDETARKFFDYIEARATDLGYSVEYDEAISVDEASERFVNNCFEVYDQ